MYCKNCGKEIPDHAIFCPECGQKVEHTKKQTDGRGTGANEKNRKGLRKLAAGILLVLLACIAGIGYLKYPGWKAEKQVALGERQLEAEDFESAIPSFEEAVRRKPRELSYYPKLAEAYAGADDKEKAIEVLEQGIQVYEELPEEKKEEVLADADGMKEQAVELILEQAEQSEDSQTAKQYLDRMENLKPESESAAPTVEEAVEKIQQIVEQKEKEEARRQITEEDLRTLLEKNAGTNIVFMICDDFDGNQALEAFALVGTYNEDEYGDTYNGAVWFTNGEESVCVREEGSYWANTETILDFETNKYFELAEYYTTGNISFVWGVEADHAYEPIISGKCSSLSQKAEKSRELYMVEDTYDASSDKEMGFSMGHTWKSYDLYWDGDFYEYGGVYIQEEDFMACEGAGEILDGIRTDGSEVLGIIYYKNGKIRINICKNEEYGISYRFETYQYDQKTGKLTLIEVADDSGTYSTTLIEEIAVYPDDVPFGDTQRKEIAINQFLSSFTEPVFSVREYSAANPNWAELILFSTNFIYKHITHVENLGGFNYAQIIPAKAVNKILKHYFNITTPVEDLGSDVKYDAERDAYILPDWVLGKEELDIILANEIRDLGGGIYEVQFTNVCVSESTYSELDGEYISNDRPYQEWDIYYTYSMEEVEDDPFCEVEGHGTARLQRIDGRYVLLEMTRE